MFSTVHTQDSYILFLTEVAEWGLMSVRVNAVEMEQSRGIFLYLSVMNIDDVGDPVMHLVFIAHLLQLAC